MDALGYTGVALLVAIENLFPPIPSEIVLSLAGFYASRGDATVLGMIAAATAGRSRGGSPQSAKNTIGTRSWRWSNVARSWSRTCGARKTRGPEAVCTPGSSHDLRRSS